MSAELIRIWKTDRGRSTCKLCEDFGEALAYMRKYGPGRYTVMQYAGTFYLTFEGTPPPETKTEPGF